MIAVALKGLAGRKVRALLTALAVVIGVTMVSGTLVLTDTIQKAFDGIFGASYAQTDAVIAGKEIVKGSQSGAATVPESLLDQVRALPEVEAAGGTIAPNASNTAKIFGRDGTAVGASGAPQFGLGNDVPMSTANLTDGLVAFVNGQMVLLRVPYPLGFYAKGFDGRIDDPNAGWKGRGLWTSSGDRTPWRLKLRSASFNNVQALSAALPGTHLRDLTVALASFFYVVGDIDK